MYKGNNSIEKFKASIMSESIVDYFEFQHYNQARPFID
jgi:hypothetical protein